MRILHLAQRDPVASLFPERFRAALAELGEVEIVAGAGAWEEAERERKIRGCQVLLTGWGSCAVPESIARDPGSLRYVCHLTGTMNGQVPQALLESAVPVTNWGDAPANGVAEGALTLLLAVLKNLRWHSRAKEQGGWMPPPEVMACNGTLEGLRLGIYGGGVIGRRFIELCRPFGPRMVLFDPFLDAVPEGVERASDLRALFAASDAVAIHAGLTDATRGSVSAEMLALLPDGGIVINTARGDIIDQAALFAELESGRLRAGLDVLAGSDFLEPGHPAFGLPNLLLTAHKVASDPWAPRPEDTGRLRAMHRVAIENLRRFRDGLPLRFRMDAERFRRST